VVLCRHGVGYDRIDVDACTEYDIALCTTPAASKHPVASASFAYIIALAKRIIDKDRLVRKARWDLRGPYSGNEIQGKTLGIVGFGNTGSELARLVQPFDMRLLAADPYVSIDRACQLGVQLVELDELMRQSDFVCVHAKLDPSTRGLIGSNQIALMKPSAYFINCARGPIVDERALVVALQQRRIAGAGLDVFEEEPLPLGNPLLSLDNVVLSPHTMAHTFELGLAMGEINSRQMLSAARGEVPESIVNRQVVERAGFQQKLSARQSAGT
jgi:phosphoglycerate dehydrogenase-like enzyme